LDALAAHDARKAELVKLRYFAGLTLEEAAAALDLSERTAKRATLLGGHDSAAAASQSHPVRQRHRPDLAWGPSLSRDRTQNTPFGAVPTAWRVLTGRPEAGKNPSLAAQESTTLAGRFEVKWRYEIQAAACGKGRGARAVWRFLWDGAGAIEIHNGVAERFN
jgi:hypothetical protein